MLHPTEIALLAAVFVIVGVLVVCRYADRGFAVPLARAVLLAGSGFMFWLGWISYAELRESGGALN